MDCVILSHVTKLSLYIHIPFCIRRCGYCDFNTFAGVDFLIPKYVHAICQEMNLVLPLIPRDHIVHTVYLGGGTPSLLPGTAIQKIIEAVQSRCILDPDVEITMEANPGTVDLGHLEKIRELGINRISFGVQSTSPNELRILDRSHKNIDVVNAVDWSKRAGIKHINLDLIFGIPGQDLESWARTLEITAGLGADHLSVYSLIIEEGTPLKRSIDKGLLSYPDEELSADMYEMAMDYLSRNGFDQYEISNWSKGKHNRSIHNMQYWKQLPYIGFGAGAHGFFGKTRMANHTELESYMQLANDIEKVNFPKGPACKTYHRLTTWDLAQEFMMLSFRLVADGVSMGEFQSRFGVSAQQLFPKQFDRLLKSKLIEEIEGGKQMRLTRLGCLFGNRVFREFIGNRVPKGYEYLKD